MAKATLAAKSAALAAVPTSAFLANEYFDRLLQNPDEQCLALRLTDLGMKLRPEDEKELVEFGDALQQRLAAFVKSAPKMPEPVTPERPANLLVGDSAAETLGRCQSFATYVMFTAVALVDDGSSQKATDGLTLVMETLVDAIDAAGAQMTLEREAQKGADHEG